jgi:hypothetical protein
MNTARQNGEPQIGEETQNRGNEAKKSLITKEVSLETNLKCARFTHQECVLNAIPTAFKMLVPKVPCSAVAAASLPHSKGFAHHNAKSWKQSQEVIGNKGSHILLSAKTNPRICKRALEGTRFTLLSRPWWSAES